MLRLIFLLVLMVLNFQLVFSQEYKNIKSYQKSTGNLIISDGAWLKKDRIKRTKIWLQANNFNFSIEKGNEKYKTVAQIRDFYFWVHKELSKKGHEIKWGGIAGNAANQLSKVDNLLIRMFIIKNKELVEFIHNGSEKVFAHAFSRLRDVYFSRDLINGEKAINWDLNYGVEEQCKVLKPLYSNLTSRSLKQLIRMVKGKGIYFLAVPKGLKFNGDLLDCEARYTHGIHTIFSYYSKK